MESSLAQAPQNQKALLHASVLEQCDAKGLKWMALRYGNSRTSKVIVQSNGLWAFCFGRSPIGTHNFGHFGGPGYLAAHGTCYLLNRGTYQPDIAS